MEDTSQEIHRSGHRQFVGGTAQTWDEIGELQFRFLRDRGLAPDHVLIDVGCGALRGGLRFIHYLEPGHYLGIDKHIELIIYGVAVELGIDAYREKQPKLVVSDSFEFEKFRVKPDFGIAQSLFTHLAEPDLKRCLLQLRRAVVPGCRLFATFFEADELVTNPEVSHSHGYFAYTRLQVEAFGAESGWDCHYIGEWNHPRGQKILEYTAS